MYNGSPTPACVELSVSLVSHCPLLSITLHFSVYIGGKPDSTQSVFPLLRWLSHRCICRIHPFPSLSQAMSIAPSQATRSHVIRTELYIGAWERAVGSDGGETSFHDGISTVSRPGDVYPLSAGTADHRK